MTDGFEHRFTVRRKVITFFGFAFTVLNPEGGVMAFCKQKAFRLREEVSVYTSATKSELVLKITTPNIIDFSATYQIELPSGDVIGSLRRRGWSSMLRDRWHFYGPDGQDVAEIVEDSGGLAFARRFVPLVELLSPRRVNWVAVDGRVLATMVENRHLFVRAMRVEAKPGGPDDLDLIASSVMLMLISAIQENRRRG